MLDEYFDKVCIITTMDSHRVDYTRNQLKKAGIKKYEFITSVDFRIIDERFQTIVHQQVIPQRYMSLSANHIGIVQSAIYNNYNNVCICEDDIFFKPDYKRKLKKFMDSIPNDWDVLNLGYLNDEMQITPINKYVYKQAGTYWGAQCVVYKNTIYKTLIDVYYKFNCNISPDWFGREVCKLYNVYIPVEHFIYQVSRDYGDYNLNRANSDVQFESLLFNRTIPDYYLKK